jgi:hypothetical protein
MQSCMGCVRVGSLSRLCCLCKQSTYTYACMPATSACVHEPWEYENSCNTCLCWMLLLLLLLLLPPPLLDDSNITGGGQLKLLTRTGGELPSPPKCLPERNWWTVGPLGFPPPDKDPATWPTAVSFQGSFDSAYRMGSTPNDFGCSATPIAVNLAGGGHIGGCRCPWIEDKWTTLSLGCMDA